MQRLCTSLALLGFLAPSGRAEGIIGYDGKEHHWHPYRDGIHGRALHEMERSRRHGISHPRLRHMHVPHMLNQAPIIVSQHNLHIATKSRRIRTIGYGISKSSNHSGNFTEDAPVALSRIEQNMLDSVYGDTAKKVGHAAKRDQKFHFRAGHKQTEQNAAEDFTAQEVEMERKHRARIVKIGGTYGGAPAAGPASGPAPGPAPMASPAAAPGGEEKFNAFNMDEDLGAAEQGFSGEIVEHDNMKTMTKDWRGEYGPGGDTYLKICALYPENQWCRDRGYHQTTHPPKSAAVRSASVMMGVVVATCIIFG